MSFKSTHNLDFAIGQWEPLPGHTVDVAEGFLRFKVGTCNGLWRSTKSSYEILAVTNETPGNGHFDDVLEWFEQSCRRDKRSLRVLELWNEKLKKHLIEKRGFKDIQNDNVEKIFL